MLVTYLRSSSYVTHSSCPHQYFLEYVLGWRGKSGLKADIGTMAHKVMEILAKIKKGQQDGEAFIEDEILKKQSTKNYDILKIRDKVYKYYTNLIEHHDWSDENYKFYCKTIAKALDYNGGMFNPLTSNVRTIEEKFQLEIKEPWASYKYLTPNGETLEGNLVIQGTIDLILEVNPTIVEVVDYKTGMSNKCWITGEEKTSEKLASDPQLSMYAYALMTKYPELQQVIVTIFFINAGGPRTAIFSRDQLPTIEKMLQDKFEIIKNTKIPPLNKTWKCSKVCSFYKETFEGTNVKPLQEFRGGQFNKKGETMCKCSQIEFEIERKGIDRVMKEYVAPKHDVSAYKAPGSV